MHAILLGLTVLAAVGERFPEWMPEPRADTALPASIGRTLSAEELKALESAQPLTPFTGLSCGVRLPDGSIWVGSPGGLMHLVPGAPHWRLFHSRRWLPDDRVLALAAPSNEQLWVRTPAGTVRLVRRWWTLEEKMAEIHARLRKYHLREGFCCEIVLKQPGQPEAGYTQPDNDNDGLWTALYVAAEAFRFGATGAEDARRNAWQSLQTLMALEAITGIPGFAARSFVPIDIDKSGDRNWYRSADGKRWWKDDTSSDEVVGHFFAYFVYWVAAATEAQKQQIRPVVARLADHIIDHGYYYVGPTGKPTTWGVWAPEKLNRDPRRLGDRGLNSLEVLSHLKVAEFITGNPRYARAAGELIDRHGYAANAVWQKIEWPLNVVNHSDDELAFLAYYPLLWLERNPELRTIYLWSLERSWHYERPEGSPLFNFIYATAHQASQWREPGQRPPRGLVPAERYDREVCLEWFRRVPADTTAWTITNSRRRDVGPTTRNRFGQLCGSRVLPIDERLMLRWNADPYQLDNGNAGFTRGDGAFILLPYWLGRYHRLLE